MNKLSGFFELRKMNLPCVTWKEYHTGDTLDDHFLWSIRCAKFRENDLDLPRLIGAEADKAIAFANRLRHQINGMVIYYPYFIAEKSGTLCVSRDKVVIEAVHDDLWNMVKMGTQDVTIIIDEEEKNTETIGDKNLLSGAELEEILSHVSKIRKRFRDELFTKDILLEWSFARNCGKEKIPIGERYLVFYEIRSI